MPGSSLRSKYDSSKILANPHKHCLLVSPQQLRCAGLEAFSEVMADSSALGRFSLEL